MGFLEKHRVIRRVALGWAMTLITFATLDVFSGGEVSGGKAGAYATCVGLLTVVLGMYFHKRHHEDANHHK